MLVTGRYSKDCACTKAVWYLPESATRSVTSSLRSQNFEVRNFLFVSNLFLQSESEDSLATRHSGACSSNCMAVPFHDFRVRVPWTPSPRFYRDSGKRFLLFRRFAFRVWAGSHSLLATRDFLCVSSHPSWIFRVPTGECAAIGRVSYFFVSFILCIFYTEPKL